MFILLFFSLINIGKYNLESNNILFIVIDTMFSFIIPAFVFFSAWHLSFIMQKENISLKDFYKKVLLNVVLPYILCMIPYIIYNHGINNLNFLEFLKLVVEGNIISQFAFIKLLIHLLIIFPIADYFVKVNAKLFNTTTFVLSAIFSLFKLDTYIYTELFNYLIYLSLGISFTYHAKEILEYYRTKFSSLILDILLVISLIFITKFKLYSFFNPLAQILYNIVVILIMNYMLFENRKYFYNDRNYLYKSRIFNPPIIAVSIFLIIGIVLDIVEKILNISFLTIPEMLISIVGFLFIIAIVFVDKTNKKKYDYIVNNVDFE